MCLVGRLSKWSLVLNGIIGRSRCFGCGGWKKRRRWEITNIRAANIWTITARTTREVIWLMTMFILEPEKTYQSCRGGNFWHSYRYYVVSITVFLLVMSLLIFHLLHVLLFLPTLSNLNSLRFANPNHSIIIILLFFLFVSFLSIFLTLK